MARWGLRFKPGSTGGMVRKTEPTQIDRALTDIDQVKWPISDVICILGHWIQSDAGVRHDWNLAEKQFGLLFGVTVAREEPMLCHLFRCSQQLASAACSRTPVSASAACCFLQDSCA